MVTMRPCFLSSSMAFLVLRSLILLLERLMILRKGILGRLARREAMASSPRLLKARLRLVTLGMSSSILARPSLVSLFLTSLSPLIFLMDLRQCRMSQISVSLREYPVRSSVSRFSRSQNYSIIVPTLHFSGVDTDFTEERLSEPTLPASFEVLLFLGVGETDATLSGVRWSAPNSIFWDFRQSYFSSRAVRISWWTKPSSSSAVSSRTTLMQLKTELQIPLLSTMRIWEMRVSMVVMLLLILVSSLCRRDSPSLQISRGPSQQRRTLSSMRFMLSAFWKRSAHLSSHSLYLFCESFSSLMRVVILVQRVLKFLMTSSQAFFSASLIFSVICANFRLMSVISRSFSFPIFFMMFSLNQSLLIFESRLTFLALKVWNCLNLESISQFTSAMVLNLWSL